jgi:hypothetical protein
MLVFRPSALPDGYDLCLRAAVGFPTDPTGGTVLGITDDGSVQVNLSGGKTVALYGNTYASFVVNANGNLTFGAADDTYTETLARHFALPRVSGLFHDLNPSAGGTVSWRQLADRVAVTWQDVPEYGLTTSNSLQIELFFDGRIRVTLVDVAATRGITGLSRGTGLSPEFAETDLSASASCEGLPPAQRSSGRPDAR